jgi:DNA polymerase V
MIEIFDKNQKAKGAPFFPSIVSCGLFGIADDFSENFLSLDEKYLKNKDSTFFLRAGGNSMEPEIKKDDILIVDRSIKLVSNRIAVFYLNQVAVCKLYIKKNQQVLLRSFNSHYPDIQISEKDDLELFGVVIGIARDV